MSNAYETMYFNLKNGAYTNRIPYTKETRQQYREENAAIQAQFAKDIAAAYGLADHPKADTLFALAWDAGHSTGYNDVLLRYDEMSDLPL